MNQLTRDDMIWQIEMNSNYSIRALRRMTDKDLIELYKRLVLKE